MLGQARPAALDGKPAAELDRRRVKISLGLLLIASVLSAQRCLAADELITTAHYANGVAVVLLHGLVK